MGSSGKKKTTMAKLTRESRLRERRLDKQAKKDARRHAPAAHPDDPLNATAGESALPDGAEPPQDADVVVQGALMTPEASRSSAS